MQPTHFSSLPTHLTSRPTKRRNEMREPPVEGPGVAPADAQGKPREPAARSHSGEREAEASERGQMPAAPASSVVAVGGGDGDASSTSAAGGDLRPAPAPPAPPPARAPSPAPYLTAPPAAYVPDFLGSFEGIIEGAGGGGSEGAGAGGRGEDDVLLLLGSGRPVARAPRDSEPGGWLSVEREEGKSGDGFDERTLSRLSSTPPAVSRLSSLTLEDALCRTPRSKARAVAASVAATVGGHGGGGGGGGGGPASSPSPSPAI